MKVFAGDGVYTKVNDGKSGYLAQSAAPLYFGLGDKTRIDKIEVTWPSGREQSLSDNISMNGVLDIREP